MSEEIDWLEVQRNLDRRRLELEASEGALRRGDAGFRTIGDLARKATSSPEGLASTLAEQLRTSATTGEPRPGPARGTSIGPLRGGAGVAERPTMRSVAAALEARDSDLAGHRLQAWLRPLQTSLRPLIAENGDPGTDWEVTGYRLTAALLAATIAELEPMVERMTRPAGPKPILTAILRCLTLTKSRERDAMDLRLFAGALAEELAEFPLDVVETALRKWARRETWWPSLAELREPCLREMRWRRSLRIALEDAQRQPA